MQLHIRYYHVDGGNTIYMMVLASAFSHPWRDLTAYKLLILRTYRQFGGRAWLEYDQAFREHAAATRMTDWSAINVQLYSFHTGGASLRSAITSQSSEAVGSSVSEICQSWNREVLFPLQIMQVCT